MKIKKFFNDIYILKALCLTLFILLVTLFFHLVDVCDGYNVLKSIIIHDYGQSCNRKEEWLQWRLDNER